MNFNKQVFAALVAASSAAPVSALHAQGDPGTMYLNQGTYEGVSYLSGGVGEGERNYIASSLADQYNVKLEFAASNGEYLASVKVRIVDTGGRTVLAADAEGPWLFARLSPGKYRVEATADGRTFSNSLTVNDQRTARLVFSGWPEI